MENKLIDAILIAEEQANVILIKANEDARNVVLQAEINAETLKNNAILKAKEQKKQLQQVSDDKLLVEYEKNVSLYKQQATDFYDISKKNLDKAIDFTLKGILTSGNN